LAALRRAEQRYHLPRALLVSIALAESGRSIKSIAQVRPWPWTINADGIGLFLESKAAAISWMHDLAANHSFVDVGCMQVDLHYHPDAFTSLEDAFDPNANADYAARLLIQLYHTDAAGRWDLAVGLYHSHTTLLAAEFRQRVSLLRTHASRADVKGPPHYVRANYPGAVRLISNRKLVRITTHRQPAIQVRH
jgi:hypothetical protein